MRKKVLALGYIPKWRGGRQLTGLATGIFDLHNAVNSLRSDYNVVIAATDIYEKKRRIDETDVVGWTKTILIMHSILKLYKLPFFISQSWKMHKKYAGFPFFSTLSKVLFLDYAIEKEKPEIIHLHGAVYALYVNALWKRNCPVVLRLHGINGFDNTIKDYEVLRMVEKDITSLPFTFVTFVTSNVCEEWKLKYGDFNCPMIPIINGFNNNIFYPPKTHVEKEYDLITIAGISERKGQGRVMEAMIKIREEMGVNLSYLVVGSGDKEYAKQIKEYAERNNLNVTFKEYCPQNELNELLWKSKFFIQPSASEGFGKTYIESAASGVISILPEFLPIAKEPNVLSNINAIFTKDESVQSIFDVLKKIDLKNEADPEQISNSVSWLSWESLAEKYISLYYQYTNHV